MSDSVRWSGWPTSQRSPSTMSSRIVWLEPLRSTRNVPRSMVMPNSATR